MASRSHSPPLLISDPNKLLRRQDSSNSVLIGNHSDVLMPCSMSSTKKSMMQDFYSTFIQSNIHPQLQLLQHHAPMKLQVPINMYPAPSPITCMQGLNMENSFMTQNSDQCIDEQLLSRTAPPPASHDHEKRPAPLRITHNTPISVSQEEEKSCNAVDISVTASKKRSRTSFGSCKLARDVDDEKRGIKRTKSGDSAVTSEANMSSSTTARRDTQAPCDSPPNMILPKNKKSLNQVAKNFNNNNNNNKNIKIDERAPTNDKSCDSDNAPTNCNNKADFIHVRARRGQATDSHSLAERVRREKISERMKYLQDLVPGCVKVTGKAMMLDEIINYVQSLQKQVEFLSMKLATVPPSQLEFSLENLFGKKEEVQPNILNDDGNSRQPYSPSAIVEKGNHTQDLRNLMSFKDENLGDDSQRHQLSPIAMSRVSDLLQAASLQLPCNSSDFMANLLADNMGFPDRTDTYTLGGNASNGAGLGFISDASCLPHADITPASGLAEWDDELQDMAQQLGLSAGYPLFAPQLLNEGSFF